MGLPDCWSVFEETNKNSKLVHFPSVVGGKRLHFSSFPCLFPKSSCLEDRRHRVCVCLGARCCTSTLRLVRLNITVFLKDFSFLLYSWVCSITVDMGPIVLPGECTSRGEEILCKLVAASLEDLLLSSQFTDQYPPTLLLNPALIANDA